MGDISDPTSWAPVNESSWDLLNDSVNLIGSTTICGVSYGVALTLLLVCAITFRRNLRNSRAGLYQMLYISFMFILGTIYIASNARTMELSYVLNRNYPGGPAQYSYYIYSQPITIVGLVAFFGANWMSDALLLWRLFIIYASSPYRLPVIVFPSLLFLASLSMSIITIVTSTQPNSSFWATNAVQFALAYYSLTVSFTIISTVLMLVQLFIFRRRFMEYLGEEYADRYTSIGAMLIESSALYTVWSIIFLGLYIVNHPVQYVFLASLAEVQIISPLLIILRVFQRKAWDSSTEATLTSLQVRTGTQNRSMFQRSSLEAGVSTSESMKSSTLRVVKQEESFTAPP
ncbi:hypothetical protein E1B28_002074 [Marasmius oreades]|uniref:Uncharacterized protein n=1 Tax=Marasmius oreades TaxID=181124 RepID=A0A9P7V4P0_9AGAR|nr:uncharacterized protein E1B28_002074 [Marasmius oreades]KAG7100299.1 hypothetical protein E1B28_002074 [Marasmius oreades]